MLPSLFAKPSLIKNILSKNWRIKDTHTRNREFQKANFGVMRWSIKGQYTICCPSLERYVGYTSGGNHYRFCWLFIDSHLIWRTRDRVIKITLDEELNIRWISSYLTLSHIRIQGLPSDCRCHGWTPNGTPNIIYCRESRSIRVAKLWV